jgi:hypothetical protein
VTPDETGGRHTVLFVCAHGAGKSRMAAAWFEAAAPEGWRATTAGLEPSPAVSEQAIRLMSDTPAAASLDTTPPRGLGDVDGVDLVVGIDCLPAPPHGAPARSWDLQAAPGEPTREELRQRVQRLVADLPTNGAG